MLAQFQPQRWSVSLNLCSSQGIWFSPKSPFFSCTKQQNESDTATSNQRQSLNCGSSKHWLLDMTCYYSRQERRHSMNPPCRLYILGFLKTVEKHAKSTFVCNGCSQLSLFLPALSNSESKQMRASNPSTEVEKNCNCLHFGFLSSRQTCTRAFSSVSINKTT